MKRLSFILMLGLILLASCGKKSQTNNADAIARDSIAGKYEQLNNFVDVLSTSMDSISIEEGYIFKGNPDGTPLTSKDKIKQNLAIFKNVLDRQRQRIADLEKSLETKNNTNSAEVKKLRSIINAYKKQLDEKDKMIADLKEQLNNKNVDIANLKTHVAEQDANISGLNQKTKEQEDALVAQTNMMNEAYVKIGTKKELKAEGLLKGGGLFSKKKYDATNIDKSKFTKVDMRSFQQISISGSSPKVLSPMPAGSYRLDQNGKGSFTLVVTNPAKFWSVSTYLVIQNN